MASATPFTQFAGFLGAAVLSKTGEVLHREGEEFAVDQVGWLPAIWFCCFFVCLAGVLSVLSVCMCVCVLSLCA